MVVCRASFNIFIIISIIHTMMTMPAVSQGQSTAPSPAPTSDGESFNIQFFSSVILTYIIYKVNSM